MILYYDNLGKLNTIIPHGDIPRQGDSEMDLYVYFDKTYYNTNYLNSGKNLWVRYKFEEDLNFGPDEQVLPVSGNYLTFENIDSTERIGSLVNGTEYAVYKITIDDIDKAGKMSLVFSWKSGQGATLVEEYLGKAEIYIEETLGFAPDVGLGMTKTEYEALMVDINRLDSDKADRVNQAQTIVLEEIKYDDYQYLKFNMATSDSYITYFFSDYKMSISGNESLYLGSDNYVDLNVVDNYVTLTGTDFKRNNNHILDTSDVVDNLRSIATYYPLSANQGRVLSELISTRHSELMNNIVQLSGNSGTLNETQLNIVTHETTNIALLVRENEDGSFAFFKYSSVDSTGNIEYFNAIHIESNVGYYVETEKIITLNTLTGAWTYSETSYETPVKSITDDLQSKVAVLESEIGFVTLSNNLSGTINNTQLAEMQKEYCIIKSVNTAGYTYYYKKGTTPYKIAFARIGDISVVDGIDNSMWLGSPIIEVDTINKTWSLSFSHNFPTYDKNTIDGKVSNLQSQITINTTNIGNEVTARTNAVSNLQSQIDGINAGQNLADIVANLTVLGSMTTTNLQVGDKVQVLADSNHSSASTVYSWNGTTTPGQDYEYVTNGTGYFIYIGEYGQDSYKKSETYNQTEVNALLALKQNIINLLNMLDADYVNDANSTHKFVTASDKTNWNGKLDASNVGIITINNTSGTLSNDQLTECDKNIAVVVYGNKRYYKTAIKDNKYYFQGDLYTYTDSNTNEETILNDLFVVDITTGQYVTPSEILLEYESISSAEITAMFS